MKALTVVWNEACDECVGFTDPADARYASGKKLSGLQHICGVSTLAEAFRETYDEGVKLEDVVVVGAEGLESIREIRAHHWRCAIQLTPHIDRHVNRDLSCASDKQVARNSETLAKLQQIKARHMTFVQILNQFFDIGDTAEKDAAK